MYPVSVTESTLWISAFKQEQERSDLIMRLVSNLTSMRAKSDQLSSLVRKDFPDLTVHEVSHLDALWGVGSIICGGDYPINPLEGFVLGAAILLHDIALSFSAYQGGADAVRKTTLWKDHFSHFERMPSGKTFAEISAQADFAAVRDLHSQECQSLAVREWRRDECAAEYLIDDPHLREHFGHLIGQVASSHHWDIEDVIDRFNNQSNPTGDFPSAWVVHPIKLACILRCADAGHIDGRRAPDFLLTILARNKVSQEHWLAQNLLSRLCEFEADQSGETLTINSTRPFRSDEASAWWVAKDAIDVLSQELSSSNSALNSYNRPNAPEFKAKHIFGANDPALLAKTIQTDTWKPTEATVKVGNVEAVVSGLGGSQLYDDQTEFGVVLRELIQNARDAIKAREVVEPSFNTGSIKVALEKRVGTWILEVEDNGVGMSERVLTGDFLDFGSSFWSSSLVQSEWPGLLSSGFKSMGRFGIGFFSVFMVAKSVRVSSRRYSSDLSSYRNLHFANGVSLRPLLSSEIPDGANTDLSTKVSLSLKNGVISSLGEVNLVDVHADRKSVPFRDFLAATTALLDVKVCHVDPNGTRDFISRMPQESDSFTKIINWVSQLNADEYGKDIKKHIVKDRDHPRFRNIYDRGEQIGLAALSVGNKRSGYSAHGMVGISGLISLDDGGNDNIFGGVSVPPSGASRSSRTDNWLAALDPDDAKKWIDGQIDLLSPIEVPLPNIQDTIQNLVTWGYDAYPLWNENQFLSNGERKIVKNSELISFCAGRGIYFDLSGHRFRKNKKKIEQHIFFGETAYRRNFNDEILYCNDFTIMSGDDYWNADFQDDNLSSQNCLIGYFARFLASQDVTFNWDVVQRKITNEDGKDRDVEFLHLSFS